jgi:hypothetical protein
MGSAVTLQSFLGGRSRGTGGVLFWGGRPPTAMRKMPPGGPFGVLGEDAASIPVRRAASDRHAEDAARRAVRRT